MADERVGLFLDVDPKGPEGAQKAAISVRKLKEELYELKEAWERGAVTSEVYQKNHERLSSGIARYERDIQRATDAQIRNNVAVAKAGDEAKQSSYQLQVMAQAIDDFQYVPEMGLRPVLNNLMLIAPVAGIAGLAVDQLWRHWSQFTEAMAGPHTPANEMERLAQNAMKASAATLEMARTQRQQAEADEKMKTLGTGPSRREKEVASAFEQVMKGQDENEVLDALAGTFQGKISKWDKQKLDDSSKPVQGIAGGYIQSLRNMLLYGRVGSAGAVNQDLQDEVMAKARASQEAQAKALYVRASQGDLSAVDELRTRLGQSRLKGGGALQSSLDVKAREKEAGEQEMADAVTAAQDDINKQIRKDLLKDLKDTADAIQFRFGKQSTASLEGHLATLRELWARTREQVIKGLMTPEEGEEIQRSLRDQAAGIKDTIQKRGMKPGILENEGPEGFNAAWDLSQEHAAEIQAAQQKMLRAQINAMPEGFEKTVAQHQFRDMQRDAMRAAQMQQRWLNSPDGQRQFEHMRELAVAAKELREAQENAQKQPLRAYLW